MLLIQVILDVKYRNILIASLNQKGWEDAGNGRISSICHRQRFPVPICFEEATRAVKGAVAMKGGIVMHMCEVIHFNNGVCLHVLI